MKLDPSVLALEKEAERVRRDLHKIPETGYSERKTQAYILDYLSKLAPDSVEKIADTGVKAVFYAKEPTETIAFRADMDALATRELTELPFESTHIGRMHACGHDGHMTMLLLLASLVSRSREKLKYNIVLLFQPAEESIGGAARMIEEGALKNPAVERIFGLHVWPSIEQGRIGVRSGPMMAQTREFDIILHGKSAHGASPQDGIDTIVASAELILMLQSVISRSVSPSAHSLITIGKITGGQARNIISDRVELNGTLRTFSNELTNYMKSKIGDMLHGLELSAGVKAEYREIMHYPMVDNPAYMVDYLKTIVEPEVLIEAEEQMAAEDFAFYQQHVPGLFMLLGIGGKSCLHPLHSPLFNFDEHALLGGVEVYRRIACI
jgi:amidohydrolase